MMTFLIINIMVMSIFFIFMNHPLSMGGILLIQTILISLISNINNLNYWYSYILFIIMVGGMMVLFIYMTSVASNEKFKFSLFLTILLISSLMINILLIKIDNYYLTLNMMNYEMYTMITFMEFKLSLNKFINLPSMYTYITMIIYLFITLIATVKISKIKYGPLRQKF